MRPRSHPAFHQDVWFRAAIGIDANRSTVPSSARLQGTSVRLRQSTLLQRVLGDSHLMGFGRDYVVGASLTEREIPVVLG